MSGRVVMMRQHSTITWKCNQSSPPKWGKDEYLLFTSIILMDFLLWSECLCLSQIHRLTPHPDVMVCRGEVFGRWLGLGDVMRVESPQWDYRPYKKEKTQEISCSGRTYWGRATWGYNQEEGPHQGPDHTGTLTLDFQPLEPWGINIHCWSHPLYGNLYIATQID